MGSSRVKKAAGAAGVLLICLGFVACESWAAAPTAPAKLSLPDLAVFENRFFSHAYAHDPLEKRLERLECLIFGSMQAGSNDERFARLKKNLVERVPAPLAAQPTAVEDKQPAGSAQYPILNTLEWRSLKKTFPQDSLDARLDRLEAKMFGQPAQAMAYVDRVERLKKTLGVTAPSTISTNDNMARGPMPKARPRSEDESGNNFDLPPELGQNNLLMPPGLDTIFGATFDRRFQQMFEEMNRRMAETRRLGPGNNYLMPQAAPQKKPGLDLPLYSDPNSI
ncbi:MAG: hypothetical protein K2W82_12320 [Candidatus Obscuribacterales bacterium]|nr:hypothetical protein [Candidatus Obscuribacterales bacterium]